MCSVLWLWGCALTTQHDVLCLWPYSLRANPALLVLLTVTGAGGEGGSNYKYNYRMLIECIELFTCSRNS